MVSEVSAGLLFSVQSFQFEPEHNDNESNDEEILKLPINRGQWD